MGGSASQDPCEHQLLKLIIFLLFELATLWIMEKEMIGIGSWFFF